METQGCVVLKKIIFVSLGSRKERTKKAGLKKLSMKITKYSPNLVKDINLQSQKTEQIRISIIPKFLPRQKIYHKQMDSKRSSRKRKQKMGPWNIRKKKGKKLCR